MTGQDLMTRQEAVSIIGDVAALIDAVQQTTDLNTLREVRARVEAGKAWAKAHGLIRVHRIELLRVECHALRRIGQLGVEKEVLDKPSYQQTARYLAYRVTVEQIEEMIQSHEDAMSSSAIVQAFRHQAAVEANREEGRDYAYHAPWVGRPPKTNGIEGVIVDSFREEYKYDNEADLDHQRRLATISEVLHLVVDEFTEVNQPFTVEDILDAMTERCNIRSDIDQAVLEGLREMVRKAINTALPQHTCGGSPLPRLLTVMDHLGLFVRIPTPYAKLEHFDNMIAIRRHQLEQDQRALDRLIFLRDHLDKMVQDKGLDRDEALIKDIGDLELSE